MQLASSARRCAARARRSHRGAAGLRRPSRTPFVRFFGARSISKLVTRGRSLRRPGWRGVAATAGPCDCSDRSARQYAWTAMTRLSSYFLPTEREPPADAEALCHKLMVRAGLIRQVGSGLWSWLPAGWRVHQRIVQIVREEMDAIGGQEMLMPVLHRPSPGVAPAVTRSRSCSSSRTARGGYGAGHDHEEIVTPCRLGGPLLSRPAADPLPLPGQGARRAPPARRCAPHARVHHEGLLHLRPRPRGAGRLLPEARGPTTGSWTAAAWSGTASRPTWA